MQMVTEKPYLRIAYPHLKELGPEVESITRALVSGMGTDCTASAAMEQGNELSEGRHQAVFSIVPGFCGPSYLAVCQRRHTLLFLPL